MTHNIDMKYRLPERPLILKFPELAPKKCQFEVAKGIMEVGPCGQDPYGKLKSNYLCREHFEYAVSLHGLTYLVREER